MKIHYQVQANTSEDGMYTDLRVSASEGGPVIQIFHMIIPATSREFRDRFLNLAHCNGKRTPTLRSVRHHLQCTAFSLRKLYLQLVRRGIFRQGNDIRSRTAIRSKRTGKIMKRIRRCQTFMPYTVTLQGRHQQQQRALYTLLRETYPNVSPTRHYMYLALLYPMNYALWYKQLDLYFMPREMNQDPLYKDLLENITYGLHTPIYSTEKEMEEGYSQRWSHDDFGIQPKKLQPALWRLWKDAVLDKCEEESKEPFQHTRYIAYESSLARFLHSIPPTSLSRLYKHLLIVLADLLHKNRRTNLLRFVPYGMCHELKLSPRVMQKDRFLVYAHFYHV